MQRIRKMCPISEDQSMDKDPEMTEIMELAEKDFKIDIDKRKLSLHDSIKTLGEHEIEIKLYANINTKLKVRVIEE